MDIVSVVDEGTDQPHGRPLDAAVEHEGARDDEEFHCSCSPVARTRVA
jgi:hypothetical protein